MPTRRLSAKCLILASMLVALSLPTLVGCAKNSESGAVSIGYMGGLSGRSSSLGLEGRDGAQLAVELANASEGDVRFVLDDVNDAEDSAAAVRALVDSGSVAIVGPMTSGSALFAVPAANGAGITLLSPTVSTDELTGIDDQFLRVYPSNASAAEELARAVADRFGEVRVAAVYDHGNRAHTETWLDHFEKSIQPAGGVVSVEATFTSGDHPDYSSLASATLSNDSNLVFLLANAIDTAMLSQRIRAMGSDVPIIATEWSSTDDLIENGGRSVDGMLFIQTFDPHSTNTEYAQFVETFQNRFGYSPGFAALHSFDATRMIIEAVHDGATRETMKSTLLAHPPCGVWPTGASGMA